MGLPPPSFSRFCDTHISSNRAGVHTSSLLTLIHPSATDLWKRIPERIASSVNNSPSLVLLETDLQRKINQKISAHPEALKARAFLIPTRGLTWYITKVNINFLISLSAKTILDQSMLLCYMS